MGHREVGKDTSCSCAEKQAAAGRNGLGSAGNLCRTVLGSPGWSHLRGSPELPHVPA